MRCRANVILERAMAETGRSNYENARNIHAANGHFLQSNSAYALKSVEWQKMDLAAVHYLVERKDAEMKPLANEIHSKVKQEKQLYNSFKKNKIIEYRCTPA